VILVAAIVSTVVSIPYYAIVPGQAIATSSLIALPAAWRTHEPGAVLLTDVDLVPLRAIDYLFYRLNPDDAVLPSSEVIGPATPSEYDEQGVIDMATARQAATFVALRALGVGVRAEPNGAAVYATEPGSPAATRLAVGAVLTGLDGRPTLSIAELVGELARRRPGELVTLETHVIGSATRRSVHVVLGTALERAEGSTQCLPAGVRATVPVLRRDGRPVACLGVVLEQLDAVAGAPFAVTIDSEGIIGPSAGLAFALGLIQALDSASLTGGRRIAATGTIATNGAVGDVGGVAQKTVAVRDAGASVFFVPDGEAAVARAHAGAHLRIVPVSSLAGALGALERMGGRIRPLPSVSPNRGAAAH